MTRRDGGFTIRPATPSDVPAIAGTAETDVTC